MADYKRKVKLPMEDRVFHICNYTAFILLTLLFAFPFYYVIINTISQNHLVELGQVLFWPKKIQFDNYIDVFTLDRLPRASLISVARTVLGTAMAVIGSSYLAYLFSKGTMWHHKFWYRFTIITMYFTAGLIPGYLNIKALGLINTFWVYVVPGMIPVYNMILVKTFMEQIPPALEESAQIDGAGLFRRYFFIMLPMSIPILATISVFIAVGQWSAFIDTVLYITNSKLHTLQYLLYQYFHQVDWIIKAIQSGQDVSETVLANALNPKSVRLTITVVVTMPVMLVYPFMQKYFLKGIMIGAIKG